MGADGTDSAAFDGGDDADASDGAVSADGTPNADDATGSTSFVWEDELADDAGEHAEPTDANTGQAAGPPVTEPSDVDAASEPASLGVRESAPASSTLDPERYLLAGESVVERVDVRRGWVVATSHRLLVFDPDSSGKRFETVDRPNVVDVRTTGGGSRRVRSYALRAGLYAIVLGGGGVMARSLGLGSLFATAPGVGNTPGVGGLVSVLSLVGALVGFLVDLLFVGAFVAGTLALALGVWYVRGRQPTLVVERAGEEALELDLPSPAVGRRAVEGLERALGAELTVNRA